MSNIGWACVDIRVTNTLDDPMDALTPLVSSLDPKSTSFTNIALGT
jgi:hypothetical protein